jgi:CheY-like chemotaxis protein
MTKILVVDDVAINRNILRQTLCAIGDYEVVEATGGNEAVSQFEKEKPDLILMDIMMPDLDGCQAAVIIKERMGYDYTPIIFLTALSSEDSLSRAISSGGDDFISKPFSVDVLLSKINAHLRIRELNQQLNNKNKLLLRLNQRLIHEQELIEHFFEKSIQQSFLDESLIKYHMSSMSVFNGDLLLAERGPQGGLYLIMGDFSGHGLTAAMGTLPVAMIFFKMVAENFSIGDIAYEINHQLLNLMPSGMFFTATILELNARGDIMTIWMGGMPEFYWLNKEGGLKGMIHSQHMPLGILEDDEFDLSTQVLHIESEDKLYLYSDGIIEAKNNEDELFGDERLKTILVNEREDRFAEVLKKLDDFTGDDNQKDDITLVELNCLAIPALDVKDKIFVNEHALSWSIAITLTADDMRASDPVGKLSAILSTKPYVSRHKGVLHVLLSEIYSNALDHSILNIESCNRAEDKNFEEYYKQRDEALLNLGNAAINFTFRFLAEKDNYCLEIQVNDSGRGYQNTHAQNSAEMLHGRGLSIISSLSEKVSFSDDGKTLNVWYKL